MCVVCVIMEKESVLSLSPVFFWKNCTAHEEPSLQILSAFAN